MTNIPDWAVKVALKRCGIDPAETRFSDWRDATYAKAVSHLARMIAQHEQPPVDPKLVSMLGGALQEAFEKVDPSCMHNFDWADFGPHEPTDQGKEVIEHLARAVSQYKQEKANG